MHRLLFLMTFLLAATGTWAQWDDEYKMEIGGGIGFDNYVGDLNSNLTKGMQPMATVLVKRVLNPYMALTANVSYGKIECNSRNASSYYPQLVNNPVSYKHDLWDFGVRYEYNFWPYGTGIDYRGASRVTPFVFGGIGGMLVKTSVGNVFAINVPLGLGVKYKVATRLNLALEWAFHITGSDRIDRTPDPYQIESSGMFKNTDCYGVLQLTLTYSFLPKCKTCNKDTDD